LERSGGDGWERLAGAISADLKERMPGQRKVMEDRFYSSPELIALCRDRGWDWRLRLKQDLLVFENGGEPRCRVKKTPCPTAAKLRQNLASFFTRGIRRIQTGLQRSWTRPPLWSAWAS
jgi:hypothetical protein